MRKFRKTVRRRALLLFVGVEVVAVLASTGVAAYAETVALPAAPVAPQASVLYYRDGHTVLARVGVNDRTDVTLAHVPMVVRHAVLAAEDRDYYRHGGVSARGVARAAWADVAGNGSQGASTITQQYVRNVYLTRERSAGRKAREVLLAMRIEERYTKDQILERYLNTIYFGRGAYGIAAAAQAYFGTDPDHLTATQGAVLAGVIKDPWRFDPANNAEATEIRWRWVLTSMADLGWLDRTTAQRAPFPEVATRSVTAAASSGPNGLIVDAVERELGAAGVSPQQLRTGGLRVVTTIDAAAQRAALDQVDTLRAQPSELHAAIVAIDPASGGVRAYYGGMQGQGYFDDAAAPRPAASTFKPIVLAAGLQRGISFESRWDGSSPRLFPGRGGVPLHNHDDAQCPDCPLDEAMVQSLNTPFYALAERVGPDAIRDLAVRLGIPATYAGAASLVDSPGDPSPGRTRADIAIGRYAVAPVDLASVYATLAAGGVRAQRHFVTSAAGSDGARWYTATPTHSQVVGADVAADVTAVLHEVAVHDGQPDGRAAAAKTGTQQWANTADSQDAWMAGYTPQLAAVVWLGRPQPGPIRDIEGHPIDGEGLPAQMWRDFLAAALHGEPSLPLPAAAHLGRVDAGDSLAGRTASASKIPSGKPSSSRSASARAVPSTSPGGGSGGGSATVGPQPVYRTRSGGKSVALTFDDGPSQYTAQILDLLGAQHIKATFCMVGEQAQQYPDMVRRVVADGHAVCDHSLHHDDLGPLTPDQIANDLTATNAAIRAAAPDARIGYFRAPYGNWGATPTVAAQLGMTAIGWTVDTEDWSIPGVPAILAAVNAELKPGGIILMHDGGGDRSQSVEALGTLLTQLEAAGWTFDLPATTPASGTPAAGVTPSASAGHGE